MEELSQFVMFVVVAAHILGYEVPESVLVCRMVQNIHPNVRSRLVFASEPKSIKDLYSLASQVSHVSTLQYLYCIIMSEFSCVP
jgi:hypothetical protein